MGVRILLSIILLLAVTALQTGVSALAAKKLGVKKHFWKVLMVQQVTGIAAALILISYFFPEKLRLDWSFFVVLCAGINIAVSLILNLLDEFITKDHSMDYPFHLGKTWEHLLSAGVLAGVSEELIFRGLIQNYLLVSSEGGIYLLDIMIPYAVMAAAVLFGLMHFANIKTLGLEHTLISVFSAMLLGTVFGVTYFYTENLLIPIFGHCFFNLTAYFFYKSTLKREKKRLQ